jgi:hypothetical protein
MVAPFAPFRVLSESDRGDPASPDFGDKAIVDMVLHRALGLFALRPPLSRGAHQFLALVPSCYLCTRTLVLPINPAVQRCCLTTWQCAAEPAAAAACAATEHIAAADAPGLRQHHWPVRPHALEGEGGENWKSFRQPRLST